MKKLIKNANDFVLAVLMLALSLFLLLYPNITSNIPSVSMGGYFTRPDVYIRMLALFLAAASLALLIRSLNLGRKSQQTSGFHFTINSTVIMTVAALLLYCALLPVAGFYICTAVILLFLNGLYVYKENNKKLKDYSKKELTKYAVIDVVYTGCMVAVLWLAVWLARRFGKFNFLPRPGALPRDALVMEAQLPLGPRKGLMVVRFLNKRLLLGVTDQQITLLTEEQAQHEPENADFKQIMEEARRGAGGS